MFALRWGDTDSYEPTARAGGSFVDRDRLRATSSEDLLSAAGELGGLLNATHAALIEMLGVIDERELWRADGCCSLGDWIVFRFGVTRQTATQWAEVARKLIELPHLSEAFRAGELSWDKTTAVARLATADPTRP